MKRKRRSPEQIIAKLREADALLGSGASIGQVCQRLQVAEATFHGWRQQYGGMKAAEAKRLKALEQENARLKNLVANLSLDKQFLEEALQGKWQARRIAGRRRRLHSSGAVDTLSLSLLMPLEVSGPGSPNSPKEARHALFGYAPVKYSHPPLEYGTNYRKRAAVIFRHVIALIAVG